MRGKDRQNGNLGVGAFVYIEDVSTREVMTIPKVHLLNSEKFTKE